MYLNNNIFGSIFMINEYLRIYKNKDYSTCTIKQGSKEKMQNMLLKTVLF